MKLDMKYVSTYTVPAWEDSISSFKNYKCYFFSDIWDWKFNTDEIKKSDYLGLWTTHKADDWNYVKIKYVWDIKDINKFDINYDDTSITFKDLELSSEVKRAFKVHIDAFHRYSNWNIWADTPLSWNYILVNNPIKVEENILYPLRKVVPFALNIDKENKYIKLDRFLDTIKLTHEVTLNSKNNFLIINWEKIEIIGDNSSIYTLILKNVFLSEYKSFSINKFKEECKKFNVNFKTNYNYLNTSLSRWFNKYFKDKLPFEIWFSKTKKINEVEESNVFYLK